jgi:hypothetical protein
MVVQVDTASQQDIGGANARRGIAALERGRAADVQPIPAPLVAMRDQRRAFLEARGDGFPIEGSHEWKQ